MRRPSPSRDVDTGHATGTRSHRGTLVAVCFALGILAICFGLYSTIVAFDVFDQALEFKVHFCRAIVAIVIGVIAIQAGSHFAKDAS
jgi:hypothetical protein